MDAAAEVVAQTRLRLADLRQRLVASLARLSPDDLAWRPNAACNSAGNLVSHICGNLRQRFRAGLGGAADDRDRDGEFAATGPWTAAELISALDRAFAEADAILQALDPSRLAETQLVRGEPTTVLALLLRVVAHIAEHVGQVVFIAKARLGDGFETLSIPRAGGAGEGQR